MYRIKAREYTCSTYEKVLEWDFEYNYYHVPQNQKICEHWC